VQVALHGRTGEVDQSQTGHIHAAVCERWNRHLADALPTSESSVNVPLSTTTTALLHSFIHSLDVKCRATARQYKSHKREKLKMST